MVMKTRGILLLALGHPYYGQYAYNLLRSIRKNDLETPIALLYDEAAITHLSDIAKSEFSNLIRVPDKCYDGNSTIPKYFKAKTHIYQLSPFKETLFLDADILWNPKKKAADFLDTLADVDFTMKNSGAITSPTGNDAYTDWVSDSDFFSAYPDSKLYRLHSELIWFKKSKEVGQLFRKAQKAYDKPGVKEKLRIAQMTADELAFSIAMAQTNLYPHSENYQPIYWEATNRGIGRPDLFRRFEGVSFGGKVQSHKQKSLYRDIVMNAFRGTGEYPLLLKNKRDFIPTRQAV